MMMIRSLFRTVHQLRNINGDCSNTLCSHLIRVHFISSSSSSSSSTVNSSPNHNKSSSPTPFVVNYLISSCGLSENQAITASKKLNFKTSKKPDSVLNLLENSGFTKPNISKIIIKYPRILLFNPQKTLKPKFDFFNSKGLSGIDLAKFISGNPSTLEKSLPNKIIPRCDTLKNIVHCDSNVITIIKRNAWLLTGSLFLRNLKVNIELLRHEGVPQSNIIKFLINQPRLLTLATGKFKEIVQEIKRRGFDPYKITYLLAIHGVAAMSKSNWESRVDVYRRFGWSEEEIRNAFMLHPQCMVTSEKKITSVMDYLVNQMGYSSSYIAKNPSIFCLSLENRIIPRCSAYKILISNGLVKKQISLLSILQLTDESFLEKFVIKFELEAPELLKLYPSAVKSRAAVEGCTEINVL